MQAYAGSYSGNAKINRLMFIAEKTSDSALALSALRIAADDLKRVSQLMQWISCKLATFTAISMLTFFSSFRDGISANIMKSSPK